MKFKILTLLTIAAALLYSSCSTDVDIIADYKEQAVIYGFLDISAPVQYIKVNKAFLGIGDANQMARVPDSVNYNPGDMTIELEQKKDGNLVKTIRLLDTIVQGAQEGVFSKENNIIYYTNEPIDPNSLYTLKVLNNKTGYKAEASTNVLSKLKFIARSNFSFIRPDGVYTSNSIEWTTVPFGKIYQLTFRFFYKEYRTGIADTAYKSIDWRFEPQYATNTAGGLDLKKSIKGEEFFTFLKSVKSAYFADNTVKRIAYRGQLIISAAGENYQIYKDLNAPSSSNFQEKPIYTNVKNGLGIFDSRVTSVDSIYGLSPSTINEIVGGKYTDDLGFIKP
jgi:hypothetical protein